MSEQIITKTCRVCKQTKPLSEFYKNTGMRDGHLSRCKVCESKYVKSKKGKAAQKRYRQSAKGKAIHKRHRQTEKYKVTSCKAQLRYFISEKGKDAKKRYMQSKKGKVVRRIAMLRYYSRHPEQLKAAQAINSAIKTGKIPRLNTLPCHCCPTQAKQYHHHKGYAPEHWLDVIPVCIKCHTTLTRHFRDSFHSL